MPPRRTAAAPPADPPEGTATDGTDGADGGSTGGAAVDEARVKTIVGEVLDEKLKPLVDKLTGGGEPTPPAGAGDDPDKRYTRADLEEIAAARVAEATAKLGQPAGNAGGTTAAPGQPAPAESAPTTVKRFADRARHALFGPDDD